MDQMSNEVDLTEGLQIEIPANEAADIFPDVYTDAFNVTKGEEKELWEKIKKGYEDDNVFDKYFNLKKAIERGETYQQELVGLEQQALDNKTNHISNVVGSPVENVGMTNLKDMSLVYDITRSNVFSNRKKKFLQSFPEGEYHSVPINVGDGKTETYEIFKYNSGDEKYKVLNPDGRNMTEMAQIAGLFLDEQLAGDIGGLTLPRILKALPFKPLKAAGEVIDKIPPTMRVMMGNWLGLKGKKLIEWLRGFGEEEFSQAESFGEVDKFKLFTDLSDWANVAISGAAYKGTTELTNYLIKGKRPAMVELTEDIVRAAEKLDLDPLIFAQLSTNPIVRRMFTQAGLFTDRPNMLKVEQLNKLNKSLNEFGIGKGDGQLNMDQVTKLYEELSLNVGDRIKMFNKNFGDQKSQQASLDEALNIWNKADTKLQNQKTASIFANAEHLDGASINIDSFVRLFEKRMRTFKTKTKKLQNTMLKSGEVKPKPRTGEFGQLDEVFDEIQQAIKKMQTPKNVGKSNLPMNTLSQLNDPKFNNLETLINMRGKLFDLTRSQDPKVSGAAVELHNQLKLLLDPSNGFLNGSSELLSKVNILNKHMDGAENVRMLGFVKEALGTAKDPDAFVKQFLIPGSSLKVQQLKNILTEGAGTKVEKEGAEAAFNVLRKAWFNNIINQDDGIKQLNKWITNDLDGVKLFLGDGWQGKVSEMKNIIGLQNKLTDGILAKSLTGTERELTDQIVIQASKKGVIDNAKYFDDIIKDYGGFDSNGVEMIRYHLIKDMLDQSKTIVETGKKMFSETIDPRILRQQIRELQANPYLMKFFDDGTGDGTAPMIEALQNYNLYTTALAGQSDVGGMIAAGELANKTSEGIFSGKVILETGLSILKHDIVARLLSKKISSSYLSKLDIENAISKENLQLINASISEVAKEVIGTSQGYNQMEDNGIIYSFTDDKVDTSLKDQGTGSGTMMLPTDDKNLILPNNINTDGPIESSSLSRVPVVPTLSTNQINPDTLAKGQQLFKNDITFAAKGGIMNTTKAFQRVA
jgi:hypothetical protein